jgi:hypothetical protein
MAEADKLETWLVALEAERRYRSGVEAAVAADGARERLLAKLDMMAERARAAPGWVEPSAAETAQNVREIKALFRMHGYGL